MLPKGEELERAIEAGRAEACRKRKILDDELAEKRKEEETKLARARQLRVDKLKKDFTEVILNSIKEGWRVGDTFYQEDETNITEIQQAINELMTESPDYRLEVHVGQNVRRDFKFDAEPDGETYYNIYKVTMRW